jgi:uncharacterized protein (TIGR00288 family)
MMDKKIALFFDAENISAKFVEEIFNNLANVGEIIIKKAYHNWSNPQSQGWIEKLQEFAIEPIQVFPNISGKNAIDIKLTVDVTNIAHSSNIDTIVLVSSDSDFTVLATDIKSKGIETIGFGEEKTHNSFRKAFSIFYELSKKNKTAIDILKEAILNTRKDTERANLSDVTRYLKNKDASFIPQNYGSSKWSDIIKKHDDIFQVSYSTNKSVLFVKLLD